MRVEYSQRAVADLREVSASGLVFGKMVGAALEKRIRGVVARIARHPEFAPRVPSRPGVHVIPFVRYPYKIFYRVFEDRVRILHIRHTSRRPWQRS